jgi:CheY-like chemotaxis protein
VRDTGVGIPPEVVPTIFDAFFTTKPIGEGIGLGLSICHRIVTGFGGTIEVTPAPGRGTDFTVLLPAMRAESRPAATAPTTPMTVGPATRRGAILVVDDDPAIARALARALAPEHDVSVAATAQDALDRVQGGARFDVILCDLMMPQITGMELHAALARDVPEQAARMIFLTGGAFTAAAAQFLKDTTNPRIDKPFDTDQLRATINARIV